MRVSFEVSRSPKTEKRGYIPQSSLSSFITWILQGNRKTSSGVTVDEDTALTFSAVLACVRILSETLAMIPKSIYTSDQNGDRKQDTTHPVYKLIHSEPSQFYTSYQFFETLMACVALYGNGYAYIIRNGGRLPKELQLLHPNNVEPEFDGKKLIYKIKQSSGDYTQKDYVDMIHIPGLSFDGIKGKSVIEVAAENIGLGLALQKFGGEFFANGASLSGTLEHPGKLSETAYKHLKETFAEEHTGEGNRGGWQILEEGMKWNPITIPPEQAQFIASRRFQLNEIARIFRIPPHMLADLERSTNNNIEQQSIEFVQYTMMPWFVRFEQELTRKLFSEEEKQKYYIKFNINGLLRGDSSSRASYYSMMLNNGVMNVNEVRALEDMNSIGTDGDKYFKQVNTAPIDSIPNIKNNG